MIVCCHLTFNDLLHRHLLSALAIVCSYTIICLHNMICIKFAFSNQSVQGHSKVFTIGEACDNGDYVINDAINNAITDAIPNILQIPI